MPLRSEGRTLGVIAVQSYREDRRHTERDLEVLTFVAQHIASALERTRAIDETRQRNAELALVNEVGQALAKQLEFDAIVEVLTLIGAFAAVLRLEDVRALRETKNRIHRLVNTEAANLERTAMAAAAQRRVITYLENAYGLRRLSAPLREIAELRLAHPDESLAELGRRCNPQISKPTASGRLAALARLAERVRHGQGPTTRAV